MVDEKQIKGNATSEGNALKTKKKLSQEHLDSVKGSNIK